MTEIDRTSHSYLLGVAEAERENYLTALRRIASMDGKNVGKYAQDIARKAIERSDRASAQKQGE